MATKKDPIFGNDSQASITDIPLPQSRSVSEKKQAPVQTQRAQSGPRPLAQGNDLQNWNRMKGKNKRSGIKLLGLLGVLLILFFVLSAFFHSADVIIETKSVDAIVLDTYSASSIEKSGSLTFSRIEAFSQSVDIFVEGTAEENVQTKASGTVRVKNTSGTAQRFVASTRFETPDGRLYRAPRSIPIPANGTVDVEIVADVPGDEYNAASGLTFTLPGLSGTALEDEITATQITPFTGGFSGILVAASDDDIDAAKNTLRREITEKLQQELVGRLPAGFIVTTAMTDVSDVTFKEEPDEERGGINLVATAEIAAVIFNKQAFDTFIAASVLDDFAPGQSVTITNVDNFTLEIESNDFDVREDTEFEFSLRSPQERGKFVWSVDENDVKRALAGRVASQVSPSNIEALSGVESIDVTITPPWKRSLPDNIKKIEVTVNN